MHFGPSGSTQVNPIITSKPGSIMMGSGPLGNLRVGVHYEMSGGMLYGGIRYEILGEYRH